MSGFGLPTPSHPDPLHAWMLWHGEVDLDLVALYELLDGRTGAVFSPHKGGSPGDLARPPFILVPEDEPELPDGWSFREDLFATRLEGFRQLWIVGLHASRLDPNAPDGSVDFTARGAVAKAFGEVPRALEFGTDGLAVVLHARDHQGQALSEPGRCLELDALRALPGAAQLLAGFARRAPPPVVVRLRWESDADLDLVCRATLDDDSEPLQLQPGYPGALHELPWMALSRDEGGPGKPVHGSKAEHLLIARPEKLREAELFVRIGPQGAPFYERHQARVFIAIGPVQTTVVLDDPQLGRWCSVARILGGTSPQVIPGVKVEREPPAEWGLLG